MHTVTLTVTGTPGAFHVLAAVPQQETGTTEPDEGPSPIQPEVKELVWGAGSFIVLLILVRLFLYPKIKKGMDARYGMIRDELETRRRDSGRGRSRAVRVRGPAGEGASRGGWSHRRRPPDARA